MARRTIVSTIAAGLIISGFLGAPASAQWQPVAPGIDYQAFTISGPNNLFVTRMDRSDPNVIIDSTIGQAKLESGLEVVSSMATRHEDTIGYWGQYWGQRYDVVAAINGDFFSLDGDPTSGQIKSGWYAKRFTDFTGGSGFVWQLDREAFIGGCVRHVASKQIVSYATGQTQNLSGINTTRGADDLVLYTHHYNFRAGTLTFGAEVLVQLSRPSMVLPSPSGAEGTVVAIYPTALATLIPSFDHVVLSADGSAATKLLANVSVGDTIKISHEIRHYEPDCSTPRPYDWTKTYSAIGGNYYFLKGGVVQSLTDTGAVQRHPRTAIAFNDDYIFFVVCDGRSGVSIGMNMSELGNFCLNTLGADEGINQDGGGSSTLWVDGQIKNVPSDGHERTVANGLMMVRVKPMQVSSRYQEGDHVRLSRDASLRVGPGANYAKHTSYPYDTLLTVADHDLSGVRASNTNWWYCVTRSAKGWISAGEILPQGCAGDFDADGAVSVGDLPLFQFCLSGPNYPIGLGNDCLAGDANGDRYMDMHDVAAIQLCIE